MKLEREQYVPLMIFFLAFIIRLIFVLQSNNIPSADAHVYDSLGLSIAEGRGYTDNNGSPHSFYPPFYPFFLSLIYGIFGHSYFAVGIFQSIIGALSILLIYLIARRFMGMVMGMATAGICLFYLPFIKSSGLLLTELIFTFILLLIIFYILIVQEKPGIKSCMILGLLSGIALLTKSVMIAFPFFIIPALIFNGRNNINYNFKKYTIVLLFFGLTVLPWVIRNYIVYNKLGIICTQGGITFYSSYCPPGGIFGKLATIDDPVIVEAGKISSPLEYSNYLVKKTTDFIKHNPKKVMRLEFKKILYFWAPFDWEIVGNRWFNVIYVTLLPFFAIGMLICLKSFKKFYPILLPIFYFQISSLVFYGSPRFRLPIEPYIFILAMLGVSESWKHMQRKKMVL